MNQRPVTMVTRYIVYYHEIIPIPVNFVKFLPFDLSVETENEWKQMYPINNTLIYMFDLQGAYFVTRVIALNNPE